MAVFVMALLPAATTHAAKPRVALELAAPTDEQRLELETRLRAELAIAGFDAIVVEGSGKADAESLEQDARTTGSFAAIAVQGDAPGAEVWVADRVTGKTVRRHVNFDAKSPDAAAIFAIRAVELLRASLLELSESHASRGEVAPTARIRTWAAPKRAPLPVATREVRVGAAVIGGPGGIPVTVAPSIGFGWAAVPGWVGGLDAWGPSSSRVRQEEGEARLDQEAATAWVRAEPIRQGGFVPFAKIGVGAYRLGASGSASTPY